MASETDFGDQVVGLLRRMELPGMANAIGKTRATMPGPVLGSDPAGKSGAGIPWGNSFQMDQVPDPMTVAMAFGPGILAGPKAIGAPLRQIETAMRLKNPNQRWLWNEFGVGRGADQMPRWELPAAPEPDILHKLVDIVQARQRPWEGPIGAVTNREFSRAYPTIAENNLKIHPHNTENRAVIAGGFNPEYGNINIELGGNAFGLRSPTRTLEHELQHAVQQVEGFNWGGNPSNFLGSKESPEALARAFRLMKRNLPYEDAAGWTSSPVDFRGLSQYLRLAGETEARNTETRFLRPELRRLPPSYTEDIPRSQQKVTFEY